MKELTSDELNEAVYMVYRQVQRGHWSLVERDTKHGYIYVKPIHKDVIDDFWGNNPDAIMFEPNENITMDDRNDLEEILETYYYCGSGEVSL